MGLLFILIVVGIAVWLIFENGHFAVKSVTSVPATYRRETPLLLLEKRYARGEIDRAEFEEIKQSLV